jgi:hypothetical protein
MKCILLLTVLTLPVLIFGDPSVFFTWGKRQVDDRLLGSYHEKQGPYSDYQELVFYFEHLLKGKHFTGFTLSGESLFVSKISYSLKQKSLVLYILGQSYY